MRTVPSDPSTRTPVARPTRRWAVFAVVVVAVLMHAVDQTAVATALSAMQADLGTTLAWIGWTITVYALGQIVVLPVAGALGDRFGTRRVLLAGVGCFVVASVACALSVGVAVLIAARLAQGMAGAVLMPSATAIVTAEFGPDRDRAVAMFSTIVPIGAVLGPVVGALIVTSASWRAIFLVNVPVGIALLVAGALLIRPSPPTGASRVDGRGVAMLTTVLVAVMVAVTEVPAARAGRGAAPVMIVATAVACAVAAVPALARHLRRHPDPVIPPQLLAGRHLTVLNLLNVLLGAAALGFSSLVPQYAQTRYGLDPLSAGGVLSTRSVLMIAASAAAVALLRRLGHKPIMIVGLAVDVVALVLTAAPPWAVSPTVWLAVASGLLGLGLGLTAPAIGNAGLALAPERAAAVSGLQVMFRQVGSIVAVALVTTVASASADPGAATATSFAVLAAVLAGALLVALRLRNRRGRW